MNLIQRIKLGMDYLKEFETILEDSDIHSIQNAYIQNKTDFFSVNENKPLLLFYIKSNFDPKMRKNIINGQRMDNYWGIDDFINLPDLKKYNLTIKGCKSPNNYLFEKSIFKKADFVAQRFFEENPQCEQSPSVFYMFAETEDINIGFAVGDTYKQEYSSFKKLINNIIKKEKIIK